MNVKDWRHPNATYLPDHVLFHLDRLRDPVPDRWGWWWHAEVLGSRARGCGRSWGPSNKWRFEAPVTGLVGEATGADQQFWPQRLASLGFFGSLLTHLCQHRCGSKAKRMWRIIPQDLTGSHRSHTQLLFMALDTFFEEPEEQPEGDDLRAFLREAQDAPTAWWVLQGWSTTCTVHQLDGSVRFEYVARNGICMNMYPLVN